MEYDLTIRGLEREAIGEQMNSMLDFLGMRHKKTQTALTLPCGETQRLGITRALVIDPQMSFLDELAVFVDVKNMEIIEEIVLRLTQERKSTVIFITHDPKNSRIH